MKITPKISAMAANYTLPADDLREALEQVDWDEVHQLRFGDYGRRVEIWLEDDGIHSVVMEQSTWQPDAVTVGSLPCWGGNLSTADYAEGWAIEDESGDWVVSETGETLSSDEMLDRAVREGDWGCEYDRWIDQIIDSWEQECGYRQSLIRSQSQ